MSKPYKKKRRRRKQRHSVSRILIPVICLIVVLFGAVGGVWYYKEYGGALFLGVKKPVVKAHGSSDEYLFYFTLKQAENFVKSGAVEKMKEEFEKR